MVTTVRSESGSFDYVSRKGSTHFAQDDRLVVAVGMVSASSAAYTETSQNGQMFTLEIIALLIEVANVTMMNRH